MKEVLSKLGINSVLYMKDSEFATNFGFVTLHPNSGTQWAAYIDEFAWA